MLRGLSSLVKPRSCLPDIDIREVGFHQVEGLLDEVMELVGLGKRVDADNGEELFETRRQVG